MKFGPDGHGVALLLSASLVDDLRHRLCKHGGYAAAPVFAAGTTSSTVRVDLAKMKEF